MSRAVLPPKIVGEEKDYDFDFISRLGSGETISTQVVTASVYSGTDSSPSSILSGSATANGTRVTQLTTAGTAGVIYKLVCTITTSAGQTLVMPAYLAVLTPEAAHWLPVGEGDSVYDSITLSELVSLTFVEQVTCGTFGAIAMATSNRWKGFASNDDDSVLVASSTHVGVNSNHTMNYSTDAGATWNQASGDDTDTFGYDWRGVVWNGTKFLSASQGLTKVQYSTDGINWTMVDAGVGANYSNQNCLYALNGGNRPWVLMTRGLSTDYFFYTDSGTYWASSVSSFPSNQFWGPMASDGNTLVCLSGYPGGTSDKAARVNEADWASAAWTPITLPVSQSWEFLIWTGRCFFGISSIDTETHAVRSYDGNTWEDLNTLPGVYRGRPIARSNGAIFFYSNGGSATGNTNVGYCSTDDGDTWDTLTLPYTQGWTGAGATAHNMFAFGAQTATTQAGRGS